MKIPENLLQKYNKPVPRYTSYPPANHFTADFREADGIKLIRESNHHDPVSIAIYIHIPFCKKICYYCGCNSCATGNGSLIGPYIDALKKEIRLVSAHLSANRKVSEQITGIDP